MRVLGLDDRVPPSADGMDMGVPLTDEQIPILQFELVDIFKTRPRAEWVQRFLDADVCAVEHLRPTEVYDTPQARHNEMVVTVDDPVLGPRGAGRAARQVLADAGLGARRPRRPVGEHTDDVLATAAGWPAPDVIRRPPAVPDPRPLLDGVRILDLGAYYAGPYSSRLLADLGADVVKVEPLAGDPLRGIERPFFSAQAGKRAMAANLKDPALAGVTEALLRRADVVHHNLRPGAAERLGLDDDSVRTVNPDIVYLHAPGWGSTGPFAMRQSFAPMLSGYAGVTYEIAGQYNPPLPPSANEDPGNGMLGAIAILLALLHRDRTGVGQSVENPQLNATMGHLAHIVRTRRRRDHRRRSSRSAADWASARSTASTRPSTVGCASWPRPTKNSARCSRPWASTRSTTTNVRAIACARRSRRSRHRRRGPAPARGRRRRGGAGRSQRARVHERPGRTAASGGSPSCRTRSWATSGSSTCSCG